jgi:hypothetical protein
MFRKLHRPGSYRRLECRKCGVNASKIGEWYMLRNEIWEGIVRRWQIPIDQYGQAGILCIGCFETLLGRTLTAEDFTACPVNDDYLSRRSPRLQDRLTRGRP